jgi:glucokinase
MEEIPVHVIFNPRAALLGAACYGLERMKRDERVLG